MQLMIKWVIRNKGWLFSGIGVFLLSGLLKILLQPTDSPPQAKPTALDIPGMVEADHNKGKELTSEKLESKVPSDKYIKLFEGYLYYFTSSLKPDSVEHVIDDSLTKAVVTNVISVDSFGEIDLSVTPWNYAALFSDQLRLSEFREAVPPPVGRDEWDPYGGVRNPVDLRYNQIRGQIRANLREYFSNRIRLESFYGAKRNLIKEAIREAVPITLRSNFVDEVDQVIASFELVLRPRYRATFSEYLDTERRYIAERYGYVPEEEMGISFQNIYDQHSGAIGSVYPSFSKGDRLQERAESPAHEEKLAKARKALFDQSPNVKAAAFAYRRYLEGGEDLVEGYIVILKDLRGSAFAGQRQP